jgi:hypothetical protein
MKPLPAILTTIVLAVFFSTLTLEMGPKPYFVFQVALAIWVFLDAKSIKMKQYNFRFGPSGPWTAALGITFLWVLFFPWYLINRDRVQCMKKEQEEADYPMPHAVTETDLAALEKLHAMKEAGVLSEAEYTLAKSRILHPSLTNH